MTNEEIAPCLVCGKEICQCPGINRGSFAKYVKQDSIREGMWEFILEVRQYLCNTEFAPEPFTAPIDIDVLREMGNTQLKKMDSQGVVIRGRYLAYTDSYVVEPLI